MLESKMLSAPVAPKRPERNPPNALTYLVCLAIALVAARTCWRIERLNAEAGGMLPRRESSREGNDKWRISPFVTEAAWIKLHRTKSEGGSDQTALSAGERVKMESDIKRDKARNALRGAVASEGLSQYVLCPIAVVWSLYLLSRNAAWYWRRCIPQLSVAPKPAPRGGTRPTKERTETVGPVPPPSATGHRQLVNARYWRACAAFSLTATLTCFGFALYRSYFTSLGW